MSSSLAVRPARPAPSPRRGVVARHPLAAFFAWFFTVGQAIAFAPLILDARGTDVPHQPFVVGSTLVGLLLPALVITRVTGGPGAVRALLGRAVAVRVASGWYALALLAVPVLATALLVAVDGRPDGDIAAALLSGFVLQLVLAFLPNNWAEEVAWSGFVQARLQDRHGAARAALIVGPLFALQHVSLAADAPPAEAVFLLVLLAVLATPFRFLTGWTYNRTGSLFVVGLLHAAGNAVAGGSGFGDGLLRRLYPGDLPGMAHLLAFALLGVVVLAATRGRLGRSAR